MIAVVVTDAVRRAFRSPWLVPAAWLLATVAGTAFLVVRHTVGGPFAPVVVVVRVALVVVIVLAVVVVGVGLLAPSVQRRGARRDSAGVVVPASRRGGEDGST